MLNKNKHYACMPMYYYYASYKTIQSTKHYNLRGMQLSDSICK